MARELMKLDGLEAWWTLHKWRDSRRSATGWLSAAGVILDVDNQGHATLSDEQRQRLTAAAEAGRLPGNLFHLTPAGARVVWMLDAAVENADTWRNLYAACAADLREALKAAGLNELQVDTSASDLARMFFTPNCQAKGCTRRAEVVVLHPELLPSTGRTHEARKPGSSEAHETRASSLRAAENFRTANFGAEQLRAIGEAVQETIPSTPGRRNRQVFPLARRLKAIAGETRLADLRPFVQAWHEAGVAAGVFGAREDSQTAAETWSEFIYCWARVKVPAGEPGETFTRALQAAQACTPEEVRGACGMVGLDSEDHLKIAALCRELSIIHAGAAFPLPCRLAAKAAGCSPQKAWRALQAFAEVGLLAQHERGSDRKADKLAATFVWKGDELL
ncbi:MAG: hypothetical protein M5U25_07230 [Planctomycetota bacterium]|nr:hypothetical protein [Planctomycetota bacterium]